MRLWNIIWFAIFLIWSASANAQTEAKTLIYTADSLYEVGNISDSWRIMDSLKSSYFAKDTQAHVMYRLLRSKRRLIDSRSSSALRNISKVYNTLSSDVVHDSVKVDLAGFYTLILAIRQKGNELEASFSSFLKMKDSPYYTDYHLMLEKWIEGKIVAAKGDSKTAMSLLEEALQIQIRRRKINHIEIAPLLRNLSNWNSSHGDFEKALEYLEKEREIYNMSMPVMEYNVSIAEYNIGNIYYELSEPEKAIEYYQSVHPIWEKKIPSKVFWRHLNEALGDLYYELGDKKNASKYWAIVVQNSSNSSRDITENIGKIADSLSQSGQYEELAKIYEDALAFRQKNYGEEHANTGECRVFIANLQLKRSQIEASIKTYEKSLTSLLSGYDQSDFCAMVEAQNRPYPDRYVFDALYGLAKANYLKYKENPDDNSILQHTYCILKFAVHLLDQVRNSSRSLSSTLFFSKHTLPVIELSIEIACKLAVLENDVQYVEEAFYYSEKSKAYLLMSAIHQTELLKVSGIPEEVISKELNFKEKINNLTGMILTEERKCEASHQKRISLWKEELFELQQQQSIFLNDIRISYPDYYHLKYSSPDISLQHIRDELEQQNKALIEYFEGIENVYTFYLDKDTIMVSHFKNDSAYQSTVSTFLEGMDPLLEVRQKEQSNLPWKRSAYMLYDKLIAQIIPKESPYKEWYIIPDGTLHLLPFDCLLNHSSDDIGNYMSLPYLIRDYTISYNQSAALLFKKKKAKRESTSIELLAFAPSYEDSIDFNGHALYRLNFNRKEIEDISKSYKSKLFSGDTATKSHFKKNAAKANVIHLAMHGFSDDSQPMLSGLAFSNNQTDSLESVLYAYEIFGQKLNADLAVLSACNTGTGKNIRGEGVMSLSRSFQYAGCPSVVMSLWSIDDESTAEIMQYFYDYLDNDFSKSQSLRRARLDYLNNADPVTAHPYYWAAFSLYGEDGQIREKKGIRSWLYFAFIGIVILILSISIRKNKFTS